MTGAAVLAADGGNSKVDLLLATADGQLLGFRRGPTISHQQVGLDAGMRRLVELATELARESGLGADRPVAELGSYGLAGADFPREIRALQRALEATGMTRTTLLHNDTFAALRAGTSRPWGVVLVCGHGTNGAAIGRTGRRVRFDAVGAYSGDWGGGHGIGEAAYVAAVRATDGRGPRTSFSRSIPRQFGRRSIGPLIQDFYYGRRDMEELGFLAPLVFEAAAEGDAVARGIVDRLADELVAMGRALIRRSGLAREAPEVVLAGGVFRAEDPEFYARLESGICAVAPGASFIRLSSPPVLGAALLGIEQLGLGAGRLTAAEARLRAELAARVGAQPA
ncbi:MAG TPA: BadF/BadG/BcrA/BcrD ATPase family protein [Candidatus Limnocylindrales bacterium]|nr:BadF/BadG/BcrA/BcrD ATPase family protein [Candidatus Limnocylindrales bacterium]